MLISFTVVSKERAYPLSHDDRLNVLLEMFGLV